MSTVVSLVIAFQFCMRLLVTILDIHYIVIITLHYIVRLLVAIVDVHDIVFNAMMIILAMSRITISFFLKIIM